METTSPSSNSWPSPDAPSENGGTLVAQRKPEGLLMSRLSENGAENAPLLTTVASSSPTSAPSSTVETPVASGKGQTASVAILEKIHQQLAAEATRETRDVAAHDLGATLDAIAACRAALDAIENRTLAASAEQAAWLREELRAIEALLNRKA